MKQIALTNSKEFVLVDDNDYELLNKHRWYAITIKLCTYAQRRDGSKHVMMHNVITGYKLTDHKNRNGLDNRRENLRDASYSENAANRIKARNCSSIYKGVSQCSKTGNWRAYINKGKFKSLGTFKTQEEAAKAYDKAALEAFGEYARLNFPEVSHREAIL